MELSLLHASGGMSIVLNDVLKGSLIEYIYKTLFRWVLLFGVKMQQIATLHVLQKHKKNKLRALSGTWYAYTPTTRQRM